MRESLIPLGQVIGSWGQLADRHYVVCPLCGPRPQGLLTHLPEGVTVLSTPVQMPVNLLFERRAIFLNWFHLRRDCFSVGLTRKLKEKITNESPATYVIGVQVFGLCDQVSV